MIDLADLRKRPDAYQDAADKKRITLSVKDFLALDEKRRALVQEVDGMRGEKNRVSKTIPSMQGEQKTNAIADMKALGETLKEREGALDIIEKEWKATQLMLPMISDVSEVDE